MKISAFYENILEGAGNDGLEIRTALAGLKQEGMEKVYISYDTLKNDAEEKIVKILRELGLGVEGIYGFFRFEQFPTDDSYRGMIDLAVKLNAGNVLLVPGLIAEDAQEKRAQLLENMWTGLRNAVQYGKKQGIAVSIEDFDGLDAPYCSIKGTAEFLDNVQGLQLSFDTGNFVMYHEDELEALELFKDKICTVHMKDRCRENDLVRKTNLSCGRNRKATEPPAVSDFVQPDGAGGTQSCSEKESPFTVCADSKKELPFTICADGEKVCTVPVGSGFIHMKEILTRLKKQGYDGGLIAELYGHPAENMYHGIRDSVRWLGETWAAV